MVTGEIPLSLWERSTREARRARVSRFAETCTLTRAPPARALCRGRGRFSIRSELQPQRELNLPPVSVRSGAGNDACCRTDARARKDNEIGGIKVRVIQNVEDLRPELQIQSLFQRNPFEQRSIHVEHAWSAELASPRAPEGSGQRHRKGIGIEIAAGLLELLHAQNRL